MRQEYEQKLKALQAEIRELRREQSILEQVAAARGLDYHATKQSARRAKTITASDILPKRRP